MTVVDIGTLPRTLLIDVQPSGGGASLGTIFTTQVPHLTVGDTGYVAHEVDLLKVNPLIAGETVRITWAQTVPETATGPALYSLDAVSLETSDACPPPVAVDLLLPADGATGVDATAVTFAWTDPAGPTERGSVVVPNANANAEGSSNDYLPVNLIGNSTARYQQAYSAAAIGRAGLITAIRFRPDAGVADPFGPSPFSAEVRLGYAATAIDALTVDFAANIAPGSQVTVFNGTATISSADTGAGPRDFDIVLPLSAPFYYDPAEGPLLLDILFTGDPLGAPLDSEYSPEISRAFDLPSFGQPNANIGYGAVTQFSFEGDSGPRAPVRIGVIDLESSGFDNVPTALARIGELPGMTGEAVSWPAFVGATGASFRALYDVIYFSGAPTPGDYANLQTAVAPGGPLDVFTSLGGVLAIVASGNAGGQPDIAPGGVDLNDSRHQAETFNWPTHPFLTGELIGGTTLTPENFNDWDSTDHGTLSGLPTGAREILKNTEGTSLAEYRYGAGTVIVTTLTVGWNVFVGGPYVGPPFSNFLLLAAHRAHPAKIGVISYPGAVSGTTALDKLAILPGVLGESVDFATINANPGSALKAKYDAIYSPVLVGTENPNLPLLQAAVATGGALDQYARLGGTLVEGIPLIVTIDDIGPGGVDFSPNFQEAATFAAPTNPYITGLPFGGAALDPSKFDAWDSTFHGITLNYPDGNGQTILRNAGGIGLAEYHWGAGTVILDTSTNGWAFVGDEHVAAPFENLLLYAGYHGQYGRCPGKKERTFDLFLGLSPETLQYAASGLTAPTAGPAPLSPDTPYFWRVDVITEDGTASSPVWSFTTAPASRREFGDFDNSGCTDITDFLFLLDYWNIPSPIGGADIGINDFLALLDYWNLGPGCPV